ALSWLDAQAGGGSDLARAGILGAVAAAYLVSDRLEEARETAERATALAQDEERGFCDRLDARTTLGATMVFLGDQEGWVVLEQVRDEATAAGYEVGAVRARRMLGSSASELVEYARG